MTDMAGEGGGEGVRGVGGGDWRGVFWGVLSSHQRPSAS